MHNFNHILFKIIFIIFFIINCPGCAVKSSITNQYKLENFSHKPISKEHKYSLLLTQPEAVTGYQTERMLYLKKPYELSSFAHNAWVGTPANMLFPVMISSLRSSGFFYAVSSTPYADKADYRLDTRLLVLHQNFLQHPSTIDLSVNVVLTHIASRRVIASKIITKRPVCAEDTPFGGVLAANQAVCAFTDELRDFVIKAIKKDNA